MTSKNVFISMGKRYRKDNKDKQFLSELENLLRQCGVNPIVMSYMPLDTPAEVARLMGDCSGAVIVGHERKFVEAGREMETVQLSNVRYSTPWNQIEGAMAVLLGLPTLFLLEDGLKPEGLFEVRNVQPVEISANALSRDDVHETILKWCERVKAGKRERPLPDMIGLEDTTGLQIAQIAKRLTLGAWIVIIGLLVTDFSLGAAFGPPLERLGCRLGMTGLCAESH